MVRTAAEPAVLVRALRGTTLEPRGLDRHATFLVRHLPDPAPGLLRHDPAAWEHRAVDVLTNLLAIAHRPAREPVDIDGGAEAVRFDSPAELLAARLLATTLAPQHRGWWHRAAGWGDTTVGQLCVGRASEVPHAFAHLGATGRLGDVVRSLTDAEAEAVIAALGGDMVGPDDA